MVARFTSSLASAARNSGAAAARNILSSTNSATARNTYTPPAPAYTPPPVPTAPRWNPPAPAPIPPAPTAPARNTATQRNTTPPPAPTPVKSTVQQIIESAITPAVKPATPEIDPVTKALTGQTAKVTPWQSYAKETASSTPSNDLAAANLLYDLDNLNAQIALAQDLQNQNQFMPGVYTPGAVTDRDYGSMIADLIDLRGQMLNPGGTGLSGTAVDAAATLSGGASDLYSFLDEAIGGKDGTGEPSGPGQWVNMGDAMVWVPTPPPPELAPFSPDQLGGPQEYFPPAPEGIGTLVWNPQTGLPTRVIGDSADFYRALGIETEPMGVFDAVGLLGEANGQFYADLAEYIAQSLAGDGSGSGGSGGGYGGGSGGGRGGGGGGGGGGRGGGGGGGYGGGGGGSSIGGIDIGDVTSSMEGWASRYLPATANEALKNPQVIALDTLADLGFDSDQLVALFGDQAGYIVNQLLPFLFADTPLGQTPNISSVINKVHDVLVNQATPGGSTFDVAKLLQLLFEQASNADASSGATTMSGLFSGLSPSEYAAAMQTMVNNASNWAPTPFFGQAIRNWYDSQQTHYLSDALRALNPEQRNLGEILQGSVFPGVS